MLLNTSDFLYATDTNTTTISTTNITHAHETNSEYLH